MSNKKMISYTSEDMPHVRFVQFDQDPRPLWATDIQPHTPPVRIGDTTVKQAYEWVKTGHWDLKQFQQWYNESMD